MAEETTATLDGYFKTRYADKLERLVPEFVILPKDIAFNSAKKLGDTYQQTVRVRRQFGWTWNGGDGTAFTLNAAVPGQTKPANIAGTEFVARAQVPYSVVKRAITSAQAFGDSFDEIVMDMTESAHFAREMTMLYGGSNIGVVESSGTSGAVTGGFEDTFVIEQAEWASGLWSQMEGAWLDAYDTTGVTQRNATAQLVVTGIDPATRTVTLFSTVQAELDAIVATDIFLPYGASGNWFLGIHEQAANTGTMFGIDAATYSLWAGNTSSAGDAAATMAKFTKAAIPTVVRGGMGKLNFYLSTETWSDLNDDHASLRRFAESTRTELDLGTQKITYYGPNGEIALKPHPMVKSGYAYGLQTDRWERIGSTDLTFDLGIEGSQNRFFLQLQGQAGFEIRCYWDQALLCRAPARQVRIEDIVNTGG